MLIQLRKLRSVHVVFSGRLNYCDNRKISTNENAECLEMLMASKQKRIYVVGHWSIH